MPPISRRTALGTLLAAALLPALGPLTPAAGAPVTVAPPPATRRDPRPVRPHRTLIGVI